MKGLQVTAITVTPVAFRDPALLNAVGVHEPFAIRAIVEVSTSDGIRGLGETYADAEHLRRLRQAADALIGADVFDRNGAFRRIAELINDTGADSHGLTGLISRNSTIDRVFSPFEVAFFDVIGKALGRPVVDLLGGAVRDRVPFSAYLFYKWAGHPGQPDDSWGPALDPDGIVAQARRMVKDYGFTAIKLKGGVFEPDEEMDAVEALRAEFPDHPLRWDPNAAWTVDTSIRVGQAMAGVLEYLEDPTPGIEGMAAVARRVPMPLATNMAVVAFEHLLPSVRQDAVGVILSDHHFWGGLERSRLLAGICDSFGIGLSMHSNSHLGISLAAMTHLAAATPNLTYACDTHWPWKDPSEDVIVDGVLQFDDGAVAVPTTPGLGIELDRDALARLHRQYEVCGIRNRDDTGYMRSIDPSYKALQARW